MTSINIEHENLNDILRDLFVSWTYPNATYGVIERVQLRATTVPLLSSIVDGQFIIHQEEILVNVSACTIVLLQVALTIVLST